MSLRRSFVTAETAIQGEGCVAFPPRYFRGLPDRRISLSCFARSDSGSKKSVARKLRFAHAFQHDLGRPVPFRKNISLPPHPKSVATSVLSRPDKRADRESSRNAGWDVVDATASVRKAIVGRVQTRERFTARKTNDASRVRQNRVVLTPVAGAKSAEAGRPNRVR